MPTITTEASELGFGGVLIQNLGTGDLYLGEEGVTTDNGYKISVGEAVAVGVRDQKLWAVATDDTDVRLLGRGTGVFTDMTIASTS